ncbi:molybdopterin converting factor subunit 1 [Uliginosibacterium sp. H3]|uniref:Molybdopterin synthase sulfur carrier subunit n=1 Tax=Uliginosibacterium silvisoli TaxID=3114758 RepID=A0ABU6K634_9RHOO|nr:molybdopterin converting factor subunit 1 [Uliginosibacterium sp. H3]
MGVRILYFASLREALGSEGEQLELPAGVASVAALRTHLLVRGDAWLALSAPRIRAAVNQVLVADSATVTDGDEVAFFPPVTGG